MASIIGSGPSSSLKREHSEADNDDDSDEDDEKDTKKLKIDKVDEDKEALSLVEAAPRITIHTLDTPDSCTHEVAVPPNQDYVPLKNPTGEHTIRKVKFLSKNSILTKPQHFHEFFNQIFFDNFSREIKVVNS